MRNYQALTASLLLLAIGSCAIPAQLAAADSWPFTPPDDTFAADAGFDLRSLNEATAGASGFVHRSSDGDTMVLGNGKPARFWAYNIGTGAGKPEEVAHEARFLAKRGVNLVRLFLNLEPDLQKHPNAKIDEVNQSQIDAAWQTEAAMKKEGIYTIISPYWPTNAIPASWNIPGTPNAWGSLFCDRTVQEAYRVWMKALLTPVNPHTGMPLAKDPAVAVLQIVNEDSLLWWSSQGIKGKAREELTTDYGSWAKAKYGSTEAALTAWGGKPLPGDRPEQGRLEFVETWKTVPEYNAGARKDERVASQLEFLSTHQREFYASIVTYLKQDLGCKQLINASNWRPADVTTQYDDEHWSYSDADVMALNRYCGGVHLGHDQGWAIDDGDKYTNLSCTTDPDKFPINVRQPVGHPFMITESSWTMPNLYQSEGPLMIAAYSALTGFEGFCWFTSGSRDWDAAVWPWNKMYKWNGSIPMELGMFPAAALLYRSGYVTKGATAIHEERTLSDMWHGASTIIAEESPYDPNRDAGLPSSSLVKSTAEPLAFLVGRVEVVIGGDPAKTKVVDLGKYIDTNAKTVSSITGQEHLDYGKGLFTLDSPQAQCAAGFLGKAGAITLTDATITCTNDYAAVYLVSEDGLPIRASKKLLLQIGTTCRPSRWADHPATFEIDDKHHTADGFIVDNFGANPWTVESAAGTISITNPVLTKAITLDANSMPTGQAEVVRAGAAFTVTLPANTLYVLLKDE